MGLFDMGSSGGLGMGQPQSSMFGGGAGLTSPGMNPQLLALLMAMQNRAQPNQMGMQAPGQMGMGMSPGPGAPQMPAPPSGTMNTPQPAMPNQPMQAPNPLAQLLPMLQQLFAQRQSGAG